MQINQELFDKLKKDKIRAINLELIDESPLSGYWVYKFIFCEDGVISEEVIIGKDMSDALYRFSVLKNRKLKMFNYMDKLKK